MLENDSMESSNDESATVTQEQLDEWAGLPADEILGDQGETQSEDESFDEDAPTMLAKEAMEDSEKQTGDEQPEGEDLDLVKAINSLNPVHNNTPFEVNSTKEALELIQKGYDYTRKMQALSTEKETAYREYDQKVEELQKAYSENAELLNKAQIFDYALKNMEGIDPDLYDQVMNHVNGSTQAFNNPVVSELQNKINMLEQRMAETVELSESKAIVGGFTRDLDIFKKEIAPVIKDLGLKADWDKVREMWTRDTKGEMTPEQAFYALYGRDMQKLRASKQTVNTTQRKVAKKVPTAGTIARGRAGGTSGDTDFSKLSLEQAAMKIAFG